MSEQERYEHLWGQHAAYRHFAPGVASVQKFLEIANPRQGETLRDLGCGTGRAAQALAEAGLDVTGYDFASNCLDDDVTIRFVQHDLTKPIDGLPADYAFCTDMLEHVAPEDVDKVLRHVLTAGRRVFLQICTEQDYFGGAVLGEPLHLTVQPAEWWKERIEAHGARITWTDTNLECGQFRVYCTAYANGTDYASASSLNVTDEVVRANVRANLACGYEEARPYRKWEGREIMLLAGGPSLRDHEEEIREKRRAGMALVTVNGTYNWCLERGITPSFQIVCDAREWNSRFVAPAVERVRYLIASQCHPSLAASLPKEQVMLWHSGDSDIHAELGRERFRDYFPIGGGSTVTLRAFVLLHMLGFSDAMHVYGFDSCVRADEHHAYTQRENDTSVTVEIRVAGRAFTCHPWMVVQAQDFQKLTKAMGDHLNLAVYGDGLIAHIIKTAATLES